MVHHVNLVMGSSYDVPRIPYSVLYSKRFTAKESHMLTHMTERIARIVSEHNGRMKFDDPSIGQKVKVVAQAIHNAAKPKGIAIAKPKPVIATVIADRCLRTDRVDMFQQWDRNKRLLTDVAIAALKGIDRANEITDSLISTTNICRANVELDKAICEVYNLVEDQIGETVKR